MSLGVFDRFVDEYPKLQSNFLKLQEYLSVRQLEVPIRLDHVASFVGLQREVILPFFEDMVRDGVLNELNSWICPKCDMPIQDEEEEGCRECDLCHNQYTISDVHCDLCYLLTRPIVKTLHKNKTGDARVITQNILNDPEKLRYFKIEPWKTLSEDEFTLKTPALHHGAREDILRLLQKYGIVRFRLDSDTSIPERLESLENLIGPARAVQNDYVGKVKSLRPDFNVEANTGDSANALFPHVDGTQDKKIPAFLAFQYDFGSKWGAESTFIDMAAMLSEFPPRDLERILSALSNDRAAICKKTKVNKETGKEWVGHYEGALVKPVCGKQSISIRFRNDSVLKINDSCKREFEELKELITEWHSKNKIVFTPAEGDIVIFDNWRLLHGRERIGGNYQRIHDRIWFDDQLDSNKGKYLIGVRPISPALMDAITRGNNLS